MLNAARAAGKKFAQQEAAASAPVPTLAVAKPSPAVAVRAAVVAKPVPAVVAKPVEANVVNVADVLKKAKLANVAAVPNFPNVLSDPRTPRRRMFYYVPTFRGTYAPPSPYWIRPAKV